MKIQIIAKDKFMPTLGNEKAAGYDLRANIPKSVTIQPGTRLMVNTGVKINLPDGYEAQIRPRSGLALKEGITVLNTPGTIDTGYLYEIGVILYNASEKEYTIWPEERIAQMIIAKFERPLFEIVPEFTKEALKEDRGGGFGSTDKPKKRRVSKKISKSKDE